jgi:hypothetical protein
MPLLSPIWRWFVPGFVNSQKGCTRLAAASDKVYQLLAHGRWFSQGTPASSTTKTGHHDIAEILLKVALNTINQIKLYGWIRTGVIYLKTCFLELVFRNMVNTLIVFIGYPVQQNLI